MIFIHLAVLYSFGLFFIFLIRSLFRRGLLGMRYTLGWFVIGIGSLLYVPLLATSGPIAGYLQIQPVFILLGIPLIVVGLICLQLSISISGLSENVRTLTEMVAILEKTGDGGPTENVETFTEE